MSDEEPIACSEDEKVAPKSWQTARRWKLPFGRHRGERVGLLVCERKGRDYIRYLLEWDGLLPEARATLEFVLNYYEERKRDAER